MLYNIISMLTGISFGFAPTKEKGENCNTLSTVDGIMKLKDGSEIAKEFPDVVFVLLKKNAGNYFDVDEKKDIVVSVGPWRQLVFIDHGAGSAIGGALCGEERNTVGNMTIVPAPGDALFNRLINSCEEAEKLKKAAKPDENTAKPDENTTKPTKKRRPNRSKPVAQKPDEKKAVVIPPGTFDDSTLLVGGKPPKAAERIIIDTPAPRFVDIEDEED